MLTPSRSRSLEDSSPRSLHDVPQQAAATARAGQCTVQLGPLLGLRCNGASTLEARFWQARNSLLRKLDVATMQCMLLLLATTAATRAVLPGQLAPALLATVPAALIGACLGWPSLYCRHRSAAGACIQLAWFFTLFCAPAAPVASSPGLGALSPHAALAKLLLVTSGPIGLLLLPLGFQLPFRLLFVLQHIGLALNLARTAAQVTDALASRPALAASAYTFHAMADDVCFGFVPIKPLLLTVQQLQAPSLGGGLEQYQCREQQTLVLFVQAYVGLVLPLYFVYHLEWWSKVLFVTNDFPACKIESRWTNARITQQLHRDWPTAATIHGLWCVLLGMASWASINMLQQLHSH